MTISQFASKYSINVIDVLLAYLEYFRKGARSSQFLNEQEIQVLKDVLKI
jgi:hypothetical protein